MFAITNEFIIFYSMYTIALILFGQIGGYIIKKPIIGTLMFQFFIYLFVLMSLLFISFIDGNSTETCTQIINNTINTTG